MFALLAAAAVADSGAVDAQPGVKIGVLNCKVSGGAGFVIGSSKQLDCIFEGPGRTEPYFGRVNKFGLDVGATSNGAIAWAVLAPTTSAFAPGALAGTYAGLSGEATVGVGVGANALVGGSNRSFTLQPLSVGSQQGLNLALGIASLTLEPG